MTRLAGLLAVAALGAGCAEPAPQPPQSSGPSAADTMRLDADAPALTARPRAPLRIDGACPFEGCQYARWTTTAETALYATPDTTAPSTPVAAGTALVADRGFVLLTRLGQAVARRPTEVVVTFDETRAVAAGDTLWTLDYQGEGTFRVWTGGALAFSDAGLSLRASLPDSPVEVVVEPASVWWAHVTLPNGRDGWLWMDRTPPVSGADALAG